MARNRIIYQSKALFIAPNSTGVQQIVGGKGFQPVAAEYGDINLAGGTDYFNNLKSSQTGEGANQFQISFDNMDQVQADAGTVMQSGSGLMYKLDRVQNLDFGFTINAQDINEMGRLARLTRISNEPPTVNLDYSYYITDGLNERLMGFNFGGIPGTLHTPPVNETDPQYGGSPKWDTQMVSGASAMSGFLTETQGQNYYIVTTNEGEDVVGATISATDNVIAFGNGFVTNYELNATVGELPTANISVECFNIKSTTSGTSTLGLSGISPGVRTDVEPSTTFFANNPNRYYNIHSALLSTNLGDGEPTVGALRPGDITVVADAQAAGDDEFIKVDNSTDTAHVQSFSFSVPLARTVLSRLGAFFGYNRIIDVPLDMEVSLSVFATEFRNNKDLFDVLCGDQPSREFTVTLNNCASAGETAISAVKYNFRGAILTSESHSVDIGGNETVDLTYSIQIGGANDTSNGLFMSGSYTSGDQALNQAYTGLCSGGDTYPAQGFANLVSQFFGIGTGRNY